MLCGPGQVNLTGRHTTLRATGGGEAARAKSGCAAPYGGP